MLPAAVSNTRPPARLNKDVSSDLSIGCNCDLPYRRLGVTCAVLWQPPRNCSTRQASRMSTGTGVASLRLVLCSRCWPSRDFTQVILRGADFTRTAIGNEHHVRLCREKSPKNQHHPNTSAGHRGADSAAGMRRRRLVQGSVRNELAQSGDAGPFLRHHARCYPVTPWRRNAEMGEIASVESGAVRDARGAHTGGCGPSRRPARWPGSSREGTLNGFCVGTRFLERLTVRLGLSNLIRARPVR